MNKKKNKIIFLTVFCFAFTVISCSDPEPGPVEGEWDVSGTAQLKGTPLFNIKLAAYFVPALEGFSNSSILVSNIVYLGKEPDTDVPILLNIYADDLPVNNGDLIELMMWEDLDSNNLFNEGENFQYTEPQTGCGVFYTAVKCCFFYSSDDVEELGIARGWNLDRGGLVSYPVDDIIMNNAKITNWVSWN